MAVGRVSEDAESTPIMTRPRRDQIDPMVPELRTASYAPDGGVRSTDASESATDAAPEAPLVPDLS